jgi:hypothetical protein
MLYREIFFFCFHINKKHINSLCGQNVESVNVKLGGIFSDHWALEGSYSYGLLLSCEKQELKFHTKSR